MAKTTKKMLAATMALTVAATTLGGVAVFASEGTESEKVAGAEGLNIGDRKSVV